MADCVSLLSGVDNHERKGDSPQGRYLPPSYFVGGSLHKLNAREGHLCLLEGPLVDDIHTKSKSCIGENLKKFDIQELEKIETVAMINLFTMKLVGTPQV